MRQALNIVKVEMQIEDESGHVVSQSKVNRASDQVVREMYMCPTEES